MFELDQTVEVISATDRIDELSTRLILDGVGAVGPADFKRLAEAAADEGSNSVAGEAQRIAESITLSSAFPIPELTRIVSSGLVELRRLLDEKVSGSQSPESGGLSTSSDAADEVPVARPANHELAGDADLIREFITESSEHLVTIEAQLLVLEKGNSTTNTLNAIFRGFHTIKGLAGFFEFAEIQSLAHEVETLLDLARTGQLTVTPEVIDVVLESTDVVRHELGGIEQRLAGEPPSPTKVNGTLLRHPRCLCRDGGSPIRSWPNACRNSI
jgi:two-component system chemotaxis sensor kinase CheA